MGYSASKLARDLDTIQGCRKPKRVKELRVSPGEDDDVAKQAEARNWKAHYSYNGKDSERTHLRNQCNLADTPFEHNLKKAQSDKCPVCIRSHMDTSDPANQIAPDGEEIVTLTERVDQNWIKTQ
ncbi:hypothetical protein Tco_0255909 [Tanacetum coccineum]